MILLESSQSSQEMNFNLILTMKNRDKIYLSAVFIGPLCSGKSSTGGYMLLKLGQFDPSEFKKIETQLQSFGRLDYKYAWILDKLQSQRHFQQTVDIKHRAFQTKTHKITIIDTPGNPKYSKNMITGLSQGDCAIVVVPADQAQFQTGINILKQQLTLTFACGINKVIVCCNKMDSKSVNYAQGSIKPIVQKTTDILKIIGFKTEDVPFVPISAWQGDNLIKRSQKMPWFQGPSLLQAIQKVEPPKRLTDKPLRIPIQKNYKIGGLGTIIQGRVQTGVLKSNMDIVFAPQQKSSSICSIQVQRQHAHTAYPGQFITMNPRRVYPGLGVSWRGTVIGDRQNDPPMEVLAFLAKIVILNYSGKIKQGFTPIIHCHTAQVACRFQEIRAKIDRKTGKNVQDNPSFIVKGDSAIVWMVPLKPMCCETFSEYPPLGRFSIRDNNELIGAGVIKETKKKIVNKWNSYQMGTQDDL